MECSQCKTKKPINKDTKFSCFSCDICKKLFCNECSELTSSEIKCIPLQKRLLKFHCSKCRNSDIIVALKNTIKDKEIIITEKDEVIKLLQEKLQSYEKQEQTPHIPTYATILTTNKSIEKQNFASIVIKPKAGQNASQTKNDIAKNINPTELKIGIQKMQTTKNGSVIIKCSTKHENEVLENAMKDKLQNEYNIETDKMRNPKIKITNFNEKMTTEEIEKSITEQNQITGIKVTYVKKHKSGQQTIFCDCSSKAFAKLIDMKKIFIGWQRYPIYENLDIPRCFQCQEFYHKKTNCKNKKACALCGNEHHITECPKQTKHCVNCEKSNIKHKTNYNTDHESTNQECPNLKYHIQVLKNKTDYNVQW